MALNTDLPVLSHQEIVRVFNEFDIDHSGDISLDEFETGIHRLQLPLSQSDIANVLNVADTNQDGAISLDEFTAFCIKQDQKIRSTFTTLDMNKDHSLSPTEIRQVLRTKLGLELSTEEMAHFIQQFSNRDAPTEILFDEFRDRLLLVPAVNVRRFYEVHRPSMAIDIGESFVVPNDDQHDGQQHGIDDDANPYSKLNVFISGGICGAISRTMTAPADRVKVLFQSGALEESVSILDTVRNIWNEGGLRSFWRGNGANILKIAPESACKFMAYDILKTSRFIVENPENPKLTERLIAGGGAGAFAQTMIYPLEIAKTRLALAASGEYSGIIGCLKATVKENGFGALYKGWTASVLGIIPYAGVDLAVYNTIKDWRARQRNRDKSGQFAKSEPSALEILATGSVSSVSGQIVAYPMQVLRTKMQSQGQCISLKNNDGGVVVKRCETFQGMGDCLKKTFLRDGIKGFYKGILPNFAKSVPAISISYLVFEKTKLLLKGHV